MMKFWHKKKEQIIDLPTLPFDIMDTKLADTEQLLDEMVKQSKAGITRSDFFKVMIEALIKLHPEIQDDPDVIAFGVKLAEYQKGTENSTKEP